MKRIITINILNNFFIPQGRLAIDIGETSLIVHAHEGISIAPQTPHNASNKDVKFLVISCPDSYGDRTNLEQYACPQSFLKS